MKSLSSEELIKKNMASAMSINEANRIKQEAAELGYKYALSMYGVLTDRETGTSEYRRIEVLANQPYDGQDIAFLHRFFDTLKPAGTYTIWIYNNERRVIALGATFN